MSRALTLTLFILTSLSASSQTIQLLPNSTWIKEGELCFDTLRIISDNTYEQFYCDTNYLEKGEISIQDNLITLTAYETPEFVKKHLNPTSEQLKQTDNEIAISLVRYKIMGTDKIQKVYFEDLISGYKSSTSGWIYRRAK